MSPAEMQWKYSDKVHHKKKQPKPRNVNIFQCIYILHTIYFGIMWNYNMQKYFDATVIT